MYNPMNMFIDGLTNMNGVIETDNIKRDFTFNLKVTRPHHLIRINKGDIIASFLPIQRYFVDPYEVNRPIREIAKATSSSTRTVQKVKSLLTAAAK